MSDRDYRLISVIIPLFNEKDCFPALHSRLLQVMGSFNRPYEIIYIDDASTDGTLDLIVSESEKNQAIKYLTFSRNFGHQVAIGAGMAQSSGDITIIMDGDLQDPPELIPKFIEKWKSGIDVVYGLRCNRKENIILKTCYSLFYRLLQKIVDISFPLDAGDFCLLDRRVLNVINSLPERSRFIRGMRAWTGFRQNGIEYDRESRTAGKTKYSIPRLFRLAVNGITGFSSFPLRLCIYLGWIIASLSLLGFGITVICRIFTKDIPIGWASILSAIFFLGGIQLTMLGVVGTYIGKIYKEVQHRPLYILKGSGNLNSDCADVTAKSR